MRNAPPVLVPVGRFVWERHIALVLAAGSGLVLLLSGFSSGVTALQGVACLGLWLMALGLSWRWTDPDRQPAGLLSWDGQAWSFETTGAAPVSVQVRVVWDAGSALLLHLRSHRPGRPLHGHAWLAARAVPAQWHGLRCAVFARQTFTL